MVGCPADLVYKHITILVGLWDNISVVDLINKFSISGIYFYFFLLRPLHTPSPDLYHVTKLYVITKTFDLPLYTIWFSEYHLELKG